ncbi:LOW QUALITY PROTEIN: hypothetical protein CFC21_093972 [Triticum aestivum]|uniref:Uncharacterized protein n=2 Tax=Triticum aestivum TaxID=4565 RepID=A0A9R1LM57_WHEAT|nr:LOW QUALITY PROTEIN: hypothetical protein CFC21_093972 [Triticum aestivum]
MSRLSVKRVLKAVQKFDEYKRWLVSEIGLGGILKLPMLVKLDLVMRKVKVRPRVIAIDDNRNIFFTAEDFHKIFGVPCANRDVHGRDANIAPSSIQFIKQAIGMDKSGSKNLKEAERFISRDISEESSKIEKDCFQFALVIFIMGYMLEL